jgi:hypothetical protein
MAMDKKGKPVTPVRNTKPTPAKNKKAGPPTGGFAGLNSKQLLLVGVLLVLLVVALAVYVFNGEGGGNKAPAPRYQPKEPSAVRPQVSSPRGNLPSSPQNTTPPGMVIQSIRPHKFTPVKVPDISKSARELYATVEEYLKKYDQAAQAGNWTQLAAWAQDKGLSVEVARLKRMDTLVPVMPTIFRNTRWLIYTQETGWQLVDQEKYETQIWRAQMAQKPVQRDYSFRQIADEIDQMQPGGGMSNQTHFAGLLVQVDSPKGRELFLKTMKEKGPEFYGVLVREIKKAYLEDAGTDKTWPVGWINSWPMNLWLIEQMIAMAPPKHIPADMDKTKPNLSATPGKPGGATRQPVPGNPPMMDPGGPGGAAIVDSAVFEHRLMLLQILSRRGGEVSAYLMGKLLESDKEQLLLSGLVAGKVDPNLFARFTDLYAEPLIDSLAQGLDRYKNAQQEWTVLAGLLARLLNDRAGKVIFASAQNALLLSGDVALFLAASGSKSTLTHLSDFIKRSRIQNLDVANIFSIWTVSSGIDNKSFWDIVGNMIPSSRQDKKKLGTPAEGTGSGGPPIGMIPGTPPQTSGQPYGVPSGRPVDQARPAGQKGRGWPANRKFLPAVDHVAAMEFLKLLGQMGPSQAEGKSKTPGPGPGPMMPPGPGQNLVSDLTKIKIDALRCLVSLYDPKLREYFRKLIDDPEVGGLSRLALCVQEDKASQPLLLKHFWKKPLELNYSLSGTPNQSEETLVTTGKISVPFDSLGLALSGISAREGLIYFDDSSAGKAFLAALGEFISRKDPVDQPERTADAGCRIIEALGRWSVPGSAATLADLIESTGDFGLRGADRTPGTQQPNPMAMKVRKKALEVLGKIGDSESLEAILRIATYSPEGDELGIAAQIALAKRGYNQAADLFLKMIDPEKIAKSQATGIQGTLVSSIDPALKTPQDIALLGLSKAKLSDTQVTRVLNILKKLGESRTDASQTLPTTLQTDLTISLLTRAQGKVLRGLAEQIGESPRSGDAGTSNSQPEVYYWNRNPGETDKFFLKMVQTLGLKDSFEDEEAVSVFITAILRREEATLVPATFDPETWNPKQELLTFEEKTASRQGSFGPGRIAGIPNMKIPAGMIPPGTPGPQQAGKEESRIELTVALPQMKNEGRQSPQDAALEGMTLVSRLKEGKRFLKGMKELSFYRYLANYLLWQLGDPEGGEDLVKLLMENTEPGKDKYLKFLAIGQLERCSNLDFVGLLAQAVRKTTDPILRARIGGAAMRIAAEVWQDQLRGKTTLLNDSTKVNRVANAWKSVIDSKSFDMLLANPMVVTLATLQLHEPSVKWIQDLIRLECNRETPITEQAVGVAVEILQSLNPKGNDALLELYATILNQTFDPEKQKQTLALAAEKEAKALKGKKTEAVTLQEAPKKGQRRTAPPTTPRAARSGTPGNKEGGSVFAYQSIAPMIVGAICEIKTAQVLPALTQLSRSRPDVLGLIALEIYKRDKKQGQILIKRLVGESGKDKDLKDQATLVVTNLMMHPDPFSFEILVRAVSKGDTTVGETALTMLTEINKAGKIPAGVNLGQITKGMLQNLASEMLNGRDVSGVMKKAMDFAKTVPDKDLPRILDRLSAALENFEKHKGSSKTSGGGKNRTVPSRTKR